MTEALYLGSVWTSQKLSHDHGSPCEAICERGRPTFEQEDIDDPFANLQQTLKVNIMYHVSEAHADGEDQIESSNPYEVNFLDARKSKVVIVHGCNALASVSNRSDGPRRCNYSHFMGASWERV